MKTQSELIGNHPKAPDKFGEWLDVEDIKVTATKRHRALSPILPSNDAKLIAWVADKLIKHHYTDFTLNQLKRRYGKLGFKKYAAQHRKLPTADKTKKGNATEVLLSEYVESAVGVKMIKAFKLKFNPNVDQAIKGDDTLLIDLTDLKKPRIFLGEAKFLKKAKYNKATINAIVNSTGKGKKPLSLTYVAEILALNPANLAVAKAIDDIIIDDVKGNSRLVYTGMLMSDTDAKATVESYLSNRNPTFVMISIGVDDPEGLVNAAFKKAEDLLKKPGKITL